MRVTLVLAVVFGWLAGSVTAQEKGEDQAPAAEKVSEKALEPSEGRADLTPAQLRDLAAMLKINKALDKNTSLDAKDKPLADVLGQIADTHKIPIVLDPEGLEIARITPDHLITLHLENVSLRNALRALLKPLYLGFAVRHEVLTITSLDCPDRLATVRTFPLGRLTERMDDPSELISTLEMIWPDDADRLGDDKVCQPRARILANHLVVRGSPRHLDLAEQLIDGLMAERSQPEVKATYTLPPNINTQVLPLPSKEPNLPKPRSAPLRPERSQPPAPPKAPDPEAAALR